MQIQQLVLGMFETNCYILLGNSLGKAIVIDPADDSAQIIQYMREQNLTLEAVFLTHGHYDHFLAVPELQKMIPGLPVYCHSFDCPKEKEEYDMGKLLPTVTAFSNVRELEEGQKIELAGFQVQVMHTPGHTPGSVILFIEEAMFTGDTLFCRSIGRTDFAGGDEKQMEESLKRLASIKRDYLVYPGHDSTTTLYSEQKHNLYLKHLEMKQ